MADFVAVIKRAVDGLSDKTPQMRERVYDKARAAVKRQLENLATRPSDAAIDSQLAKLEAAIEMVENDFAEAETPARAAPAADVSSQAAEPLREDEPLHDEEPWRGTDSRSEDESPSEPALTETPDDGDASADRADEASAGNEGAADDETEAAPHVPDNTPEDAPETPPANVEPAGRIGPNPVPFGSYAIGRVPSFPVRPRQEEASGRFAESGFRPSRYQASFGAADDDAGQPPSDSGSVAAADVPDAEPVAPTTLERPSAVDVPGSFFGYEDKSEASEAAPAEVADAEPVELQTLDPSRRDKDAAQAAAPVSPAASAGAPDPGLVVEPASAHDRDRADDSPEAFFESEIAGYDDDGGDVRPNGENAPGTGHSPDDAIGVAGRDAALAGSRRPTSAPARKRRGGWKRLAAGLVLLLLAGGAGYAAWSNQERIVALFAGDTRDVAEETAQPGDDAPAPDATVAEDDTASEADEEIAAVTPDQPDEAPTPAEPETPSAEPPATESGVQKFTQRLMADGSEVDEGPADAVAQPVPGAEGRSLSVQSEDEPQDRAATPADEQPIDEEDIAASDAADDDAVAESEEETEEAAAAPLGVGQTMFLYEERLGDLDPTALEGGVVWTSVQESPGGDAGPETAIRGELTVPEKNLTALITIKRNADASLPASHLIEIVFSLPATFEGGGIETVQRVAFKETEEARGNELIAVPAKITDDFFMVALNDFAEAVSTNTTLMRERDWIDIPIIYGNGRRALLTLEKGAAGTEVFNRAINEWRARSGGTAGQ